MITFKAQYIRPVDIKRKGKDCCYHNYQVSLVEFNPKSANDYISLNKTNCKWANCQSILHEITRIFNFLHQKLREPQQERFFGITEQTENFETLDENKILGVLQTRRNQLGELEIEHLQVSPYTNYDAVVRKYNNIGRTLLENLKEIYKDEKEIVVNALDSATTFYEKLGFIKTAKKNIMVFKR